MEEQNDTHPELPHATCSHSESHSYSCHQVGLAQNLPSNMVFLKKEEIKTTQSKASTPGADGGS